eukprot:3806646-Rhodomonas_salina.1
MAHTRKRASTQLAGSNALTAMACGLTSTRTVPCRSTTRVISEKLPGGRMVRCELAHPCWDRNSSQDVSEHAAERKPKEYWSGS